MGVQNEKQWADMNLLERFLHRRREQRKYREQELDRRAGRQRTLEAWDGRVDHEGHPVFPLDTRALMEKQQHGASGVQGPEPEFYKPAYDWASRHELGGPEFPIDGDVSDPPPLDDLGESGDGEGESWMDGDAPCVPCAIGRHRDCRDVGSASIGVRCTCSCLSNRPMTRAARDELDQREQNIAGTDAHLASLIRQLAESDGTYSTEIMGVRISKMDPDGSNPEERIKELQAELVHVRGRLQDRIEAESVASPEGEVMLHRDSSSLRITGFVDEDDAVTWGTVNLPKSRWSYYPPKDSDSDTHLHFPRHRLEPKPVWLVRAQALEEVARWADQPDMPTGERGVLTSRDLMLRAAAIRAAGSVIGDAPEDGQVEQ